MLCEDHYDTLDTSHLGSSEGIWAGRVSSTSLRSLWASLRRSATCRWSFRRSTASIIASFRTLVMKASRGSSEKALEESERKSTHKVTQRTTRVSVDTRQLPMTHRLFQLRASSESPPAPSPPPTAWPPKEQSIGDEQNG